MYNTHVYSRSLSFSFFIIIQLSLSLVLLVFMVRLPLFWWRLRTCRCSFSWVIQSLSISRYLITTEQFGTFMYTHYARTYIARQWLLINKCECDTQNRDLQNEIKQTNSNELPIVWNFIFWEMTSTAKSRDKDYRGGKKSFRNQNFNTKNLCDFCVALLYFNSIRDF